MLIVGGLAVRSLLAFRADADWVAHTHQVITSAGDLLGDVIDVQTGMRGYIITGEERYLAPYRSGVAELPGDYERLRTRTRDNPRQQLRIAELAPLIEHRLVVAAAKLEARRTKGFAEAQAIFLTDEGKRVTDRIREVVGEINAEEYQLLALRDRASKASGRRTLAFIGAFGGLAALLLGATSLRIRREMAGRWRAQARIEILNADLETRATELTVARERAEESDRLKSAFLATMSHELRTPLNSIIGFTGILLQGLAGPLNPEQGKQLGMVQNSARHLLALINDILDLSKIEAGELKVSCEPFDLRASIEKAVGIVRPLAEKKGLALRLDVAPGVGKLVSDARRVEQILINLLTNAIKFTERGEVTLTTTLNPQLSTLNFAITDTGMGIKPEDLAMLFKPFHQIDNGLARNHEGTGLGLAICRRLAELLGGEIHAASERGRGSTFTFTLPLVK